MKLRESIKKRALRGGAWLGIGSAAESVLRFARNAILARLIAPEAFGAMAIILAISTAFESLTQIGIKEAIIQSPEGERKQYLNGTWWIAFGRSLFLYAAGFAAAAPLARFYGNMDLVPMMKVAFLTIVFNGAMSSRAYVAVKQMRFRDWAFIFHGGGIIGILVALVLSFTMRNVWALVIGFAAEALARSILSFIIAPFWPGFTFNRDSIRALLRFSRGMIGLPILTFIFMRADVFVAGKMLTAGELGLYTMAVSLARMPFTFLSSVLNRLMMPMFSEIQDNLAETNAVLLKITGLIVYVGSPIFVFAAFYGSEFLAVVYGPKYSLVHTAFAIMVCVELLRMSSVPMAAVYLSIGRPELHRLFTGVRAGVILLAIYPAIKWFGLIGAAASGLLAMVIGYFYQTKRMKALTGLDPAHFVPIFLKGILISAIVVVPWVLTLGLRPFSPWLSVIPGALACVLAGSLAAMSFFKPGLAKGWMRLLPGRFMNGH